MKLIVVIAAAICSLAAHGAHIAPWGGDANAPFSIGMSASADEPVLDQSEISGQVPIYGRLADVRDTTANIKEVWNNPSSGEAWMGLAMSGIAWLPGFGDAAKGAYRGARNAVDEVDEMTMLFRHQPELIKSTNGFARKQVDDVAREFGIKGVERNEFGKYIEMLKDDVDRMGGAQNYSYQELRRIAREFKGR